jgi:uncharacterized membrane protein (DUF485 family)
MSKYDFTQIAQSEEFKSLYREKQRFVMPSIVFFLAFYFSLPFITATSDCLNQIAFAGISWAWIYAFSQFIMTWTMCLFYMKKVKNFDQKARLIKEKILNGGYNT